MFRSVVLLCVVVALVKGQSTQVNQCRAGNGELPINAYVEGCTTPPCAVPQQSEVVIHLAFRATRDIKSMETLATAYLTFVPLPYPLEDAANTCDFLTNIECPISNGELINYTLRFIMDEFFPLIPVNFEFRIVDENRNSITCITIPVTVVPADNRDNALNVVADN